MASMQRLGDVEKPASRTPKGISLRLCHVTTTTLGSLLDSV